MSGADRDAQVLVGRVVGVFGLRGDVKVAASFLELRPGLALTGRAPGQDARTLIIERVRPATGHVRVLFEGVTDADQAQALRGTTLHARAADLPPLPANAYRESELVGMTVTDARLGELGAVVGVARYPGADMLVVGPKRALVPMLEAYGLTVDRVARVITTRLPAGFEDLL
ncbi:MAG TPA: ribosome maturation factor RimM [Candidatus Eremiobacteraceae bacterium]|nr:ribosome maturation factor RimM [Candidatus Eremiobacteraceae bacterium]